MLAVTLPLGAVPAVGLAVVVGASFAAARASSVRGGLLLAVGALGLAAQRSSGATPAWALLAGALLLVAAEFAFDAGELASVGHVDHAWRRRRVRMRALTLVGGVAACDIVIGVASAPVRGGPALTVGGALAAGGVVAMLARLNRSSRRPPAAR